MLDLFVASPFPGYVRGQIITDTAAISAILAGPYADNVRQVIITTSAGAGGANAINGVPSVIQVGSIVPGTYQAAQSGFYVCLRLAGVDQLPRVALPSTTGSLPSLVPTSPGSGTIAMYGAATGGLPLIETGTISFTTAAVNGVVLPPNAVLIGSDAYGVPTVITLGNGLALNNGVLTATGTGALLDSAGNPLADDVGTILLVG